MKFLSFCAALGAAVVLSTGCHREDAAPVASVTPSPPPTVSTTPAPRKEAVVYVVNPQATGDQDPLMPRTVPLRHPESPARDAVEALLQADGSPLPKDTALRGITIDSGIATLDFSQSIVSETNGEGHQSDALTALGRTLGQFPDIRQYQIEVKGQVVKSFGEFTTDGPLDVIRPASVPPAKEAAP